MMAVYILDQGSIPGILINLRIKKTLENFFSKV